MYFLISRLTNQVYHMILLPSFKINKLAVKEREIKNIKIIPFWNHLHLDHFRVAFYLQKYLIQQSIAISNIIVLIKVVIILLNIILVTFTHWPPREIDLCASHRTFSYHHQYYCCC